MENKMRQQDILWCPNRASNNSFHNISKSGKSTHNFVIIGAFSKLFDSISIYH